MSRRADIVALGAALAAHFALATVLAELPGRIRHERQIVEVEVRKPPVKIAAPEPPKLTPPEPPPPPPVRPRVRTRKVAATPSPPNATPPKEPPKEPPKPVFGVTMSSTTEADSSIVVPVGNTTMIDPAKSAKHSGPAVPLPASPAGAAAYQPVSEFYVKEMPDIDSEACGRMITYPAEAEQLGIEGDVKLRVALDEKGHVHDIKVLAGLGHGLDQVALNALKYKCKFKPAMGTNGKPVPFVIPTYVFHFEIPR